MKFSAALIAALLACAIAPLAALKTEANLRDVELHADGTVINSASEELPTTEDLENLQCGRQEINGDCTNKAVGLHLEFEREDLKKNLCTLTVDHQSVDGKCKNSALESDPVRILYMSDNHHLPCKCVRLTPSERFELTRRLNGH